jgi:hypothetical protein
MNLALCVALLALSVAASQAPPLAGPRQDATRPLDQSQPSHEPPSDAEGLASALERAASGDTGSLYLLVRCPSGSRVESVEVFGSGVAVWSGSRQIGVEPALVRRIASTLMDAGFAAMPATYGGTPAALRDSPKVPRAGAEVVCQVSLELDGASKSVIQLRKGEQSAELRALAGAVLDLLRPHASSGFAPRNLASALQALGSGELAPELLGVSLHRRPSGAGSASLLSVRRGRAETREHPGTPRETARSLTLKTEELRALAGLLARVELEALPANLWADQYTELDVSVMRFRKSIQARRFDGMTKASHGARQQDFDRLRDGLVELERRVAREGSESLPAGKGGSLDAR